MQADDGESRGDARGNHPTQESTRNLLIGQCLGRIRFDDRYIADDSANEVERDSDQDQDKIEPDGTKTDPRVLALWVNLREKAGMKQNYSEGYSQGFTSPPRPW